MSFCAQLKVALLTHKVPDNLVVGYCSTCTSLDTNLPPYLNTAFGCMCQHEAQPFNCGILFLKNPLLFTKHFVQIIFGEEVRF